MTWITVTAVPNEEHLDTPRAKLLLDTDSVVAFGARTGEHTQLWTNYDPEQPTLEIAESLEEIEALIDAGERKAEERRADVLFKRGTTPDTTMLVPRT